MWTDTAFLASLLTGSQIIFIEMEIMLVNAPPPLTRFFLMEQIIRQIKSVGEQVKQV
jgi:hypothetical protein